MQSLTVAAIFFALYLYFRAKDRRLLRNGVFLLATGWFALLGVLNILATVVPGFEGVLVALLLITPLAVLVLAVFLIGNGVTVVRAEGRSVATALSLLLGLAIIALPVVAVVLVRLGGGVGLVVAALLFFVCSYLGVFFLVFLAYSLAYGRMTHDVRPRALVILGSRIIDGRVPPLLRSRLDKALAIYRQESAVGPAPLLIPSGGQGEDETRAEGDAMAEYLLAQGADPADVRPEVRARNTHENLVLSARVQEEAGRPGPVLAVTNNYHVLRTAILARRIGSEAQVVGSPTARYYVPSAFLREFVAVLVQYRWMHLLMAIPVAGLTGLLVAGLVNR